ncbi:NAD(P)H-dependent oxidoreductase [Microbispora sp. RL4-1S]|uniref:NAD(P)H-dependent oxidoreductase n=1 Tax=Microbispora oryzae TaxID=2806554 RepID=A0A940WD82_9ACTN|nr:NAD(P)H-dependent oxidoreductase [Microbispora oryzae]MBP2703384.1 NAD(P)H-dependent oxidoreductase [Microbispora oryzae]
MSIVTLVGNPRGGSRTLAVAVRAAEEVARALAARPASGVVAGVAVAETAGPGAPVRGDGGGSSLIDVIDLSGLAGQVFTPEPSAAVEAALDLVLDADVLVVASPTYKGTYTGLLKAFLDRLPHRGLAGKAALPLLVMGDPQHSLAVEVHLRPLLVELGAIVPTPGLVVLESRIPDLDDVVSSWAAQVVPQLPVREGVPV